MSIARAIVLVALLLGSGSLLVACGSGTTVTRESGGSFDRESPTFVDRESPGNGVSTPRTNEPVLVPADAAEIVPPPAELASVPVEPARAGSDTVLLYVWNPRGRSRVLLTEGERATLPFGPVIAVDATGANGVVSLVLDGKRLPLAREREQVRAGDTYVFLGPVELDEAIEPAQAS
jgi:hypothetical protein